MGDEEYRKQGSLVNRVMAFIITTLLALSILISGVSFFFVSGSLNTNIAATMNNLTTSEGAKLDQNLMQIEDSVNAMSALATESISSTSVVRDLEQRKKLVQRIEKLFQQTGQSISMVQANYMIFSLNITGREDGFLYTRDGMSGEMKKRNLTNIRHYKEDDVEHVGWYYQPIEAGKPIWMRPYFNKNQQKYLISYIYPVYVNGVFVCSLGMDMDFEMMIQKVDKIHFYQSGYAYLKNADHTEHYHAGFLKGEVHGDEVDHGISNEELWNQSSSKGKVIRYSYQGKDCVQTFVTLRNDLQLVLCDSYREVYGARRVLLKIQIFICVFFSALAITIAFIFMKKIIVPLRMLTAAVVSIKEGVYTVDLPKQAPNEIGTLTEGFRIALSALQDREENSHFVARHDGLTGLLNRYAYDVITDELCRSKRQLAFIIMDVDKFKTINDTYGHEKGDHVLERVSELLKLAFPEACAHIRMGGDEFVVLIQDISEKSAPEIVARVQLMNAELSKETASTPATSVSAGVAFSIQGFTLRLYKKADTALYYTKNTTRCGCTVYRDELGLKTDKD